MGNRTNSCLMLTKCSHAINADLLIFEVSSALTFLALIFMMNAIITQPDITTSLLIGSRYLV